MPIRVYTATSVNDRDRKIIGIGNHKFTRCKKMKTAIVVALLTVVLMGGFSPAAYAQQQQAQRVQRTPVVVDVAKLPICGVESYPAFPFGPSFGFVTDVDYSGSRFALTPGQEPFTAGLLAHRLRAVAPGEDFRFKGEYFGPGSRVEVSGPSLPTTLNGIMVTFAGKPAGLYYTGINWDNPIELAGGSALSGIVPVDVVPDEDGTIQVAVLGENGTCKGQNSPFRVPLVGVSDATFGYPLDSDHPPTSGFVRIWSFASPSALAVDGTPVEALQIGPARVAAVRHVFGAAQVKRPDGTLVASFPVPAGQ